MSAVIPHAVLISPKTDEYVVFVGAWEASKLSGFLNSVQSGQIRKAINHSPLELKQIESDFHKDL